MKEGQRGTAGNTREGRQKKLWNKSDPVWILDLPSLAVHAPGSQIPRAYMVLSTPQAGGQRPSLW